MKLMGINELNDAWIAKGQEVSDLNNKLNAAVLDDNFTKDKFAELKEQRDNAKIQRDAIKDQLDEARAQKVKAMKSEDKKPLNKKEMDIKDQFVREFKDMVTSGKTGTGNGGLTIPDDIQYAIHQLVRQFATLQNLVNVESVTTTTGTRTYEKLSDITPMTDLDDETATIPDMDDPELTLIKYAIHRYAAIQTVTNSLLKDTVENILAWLSNWVAKKVTVTRNAKIIEAMGKPAKKPTIASFDDIKDLENNTLDPAIMSSSSFVTNQSGYNVLSKVKDAQGRYMLQRDVTQPDVYRLDGKTITVVADKWLPDVAAGTHPLYFGDLKQGITLYDREHMSLLSTNIGAGAFEHDLYKVRVIDRFDVEVIDDGAWATASFKAVANQQATTPEASGKTA
ncbi:phage major head protein [Limosilactobacillus reuteri subsp. reuteri JCM 1112]|jgi:HK97 family phage major capsid protein|nr:head related major capsid protein [Lactobacillus phage LR2]EEI08295.1 phage major capsid protein, HK97 family [Limosilactobacillus reuteri MM2-3]EGC16010.1 phage major capsid protein, HK97 family [Limosilactobacillus reuteri MM4-1A]MCT3210406.1 phage major capsid protein [Limosilactobacillus reuteri]BAG25575.1 phage major head protein [Limosilactobacillus reuteri subsp. reuteri JCM 1112]